MTTYGRAAEESAFVRTYAVTRGRTKPRHLLALETVLEAGQGRPGPAQAEECGEILALCRERRRSVVELAGRLGRPVTAVKVLVSDLLDADALVVPPDPVLCRYRRRVRSVYPTAGSGFRRLEEEVA